MSEPEPWREAANVIVSEISFRAREVWDREEAARQFVTERAGRLAQLAWRYAREGDPLAKEKLKIDMIIVKQSIENEMARLALVTDGEARAVFVAATLAALGSFARAIPALFDS